MAATIFQSSLAVLSFYENSFLPYKCFSDVTVTLNTDDQGVATLGDGHWAKTRYKGLNWTVDLSGPIMLDPSNFTGFDILENQLGFSNVIFRLAMYDTAGNIKSFEGEAMVSSSAVALASGSVIKDSIQLKGFGELMYFDGLIPCPTSIDSITPTGMTNADGIVHLTYTYTGAVYQVKYRANNTGPWYYSAVGVTIDIPGLPLGLNTVEIVPVCTNNYEGTSNTTSFTITHALTCTTSVSSITDSITGSTVILTITFSASMVGASYKYRLNDGSGYGAFVVVPGPFPNPTNLILSLPIGSYTIEVTPVCANGVSGTAGTHSFNVTSSSTLSTINYNFTAIPGGSPNFRVFVNGGLAVNLSATGSGSIIVNSGDVVMVQQSVSFAGRDMTTFVENTTTSATLYNHSIVPTPSSPVTDSYSFTANGDSFQLTGTISP